MSVIKKGFVVYFNNYPLMSALPFEQQGMLFSALMIYADRVWRDRSVTMEEVLEGFPRLSPETRMACGFMGAAIQRDTDAWLNRREYRQQSKPGCQKRGGPGDSRPPGQRGHGPAPAAAGAGDSEGGSLAPPQVLALIVPL